MLQSPAAGQVLQFAFQLLDALGNPCLPTGLVLLVRATNAVGASAWGNLTLAGMPCWPSDTSHVPPSLQHAVREVLTGHRLPPSHQLWPAQPAVAGASSAS